MRKSLIYSPQPNATPDEVMEVLKVFTYTTLPPNLRTMNGLEKVYNMLPDNAKRHFKLKEEND